MDRLDLSDCSSNKEVTDRIKGRVTEVGVDALTEALSSSFVCHEEATRKIYAALAIGKNAILYGPGGFGKSVLVKAICEELGLPIIFKVGYKGMTPEEILGVPNMKALLEESKYETAFENSVFNKPGILVLEEFMDADPSTAAALKDVLTERGFREGTEFKESMIATVIICGNKNPDDVSIDDSTTAFYKERFPFRHEMIWKSFEEIDYIKFFKAVYDTETYREKYEELLLVSKLCSATNERVSPRVALDAAAVAIEVGPEFLDTVEGINTSMITSMLEEVKLQAAHVSEAKLLDKIREQAVEIIDELRNPDRDLYDYIATGEVVQGVKDRLRRREFSDDSIALYAEITTLLDHALRTVHQITLRSCDVVWINANVNKCFKE